ncbi:hypothetical protein BAUCODRAFT_34318 [Baudoinia panamericana UAMH 10762]|uniref:Uncharacterized protein n=1 Tax=Baudoinia panamericana (strain UAMH 10762) TaxID=717646 RepID=M2LMM4_BAUPA|nr:uncharacterized protein BAUCODRAFT_34318 [Baudoinia panamericana UAMH 10762]EMC95567.1 hypothetical protein BAUCODRAFT_34318 [Baudoinia panamericana UAMH 10762]
MYLTQPPLGFLDSPYLGDHERPKGRKRAVFTQQKIGKPIFMGSWQDNCIRDRIEWPLVYGGDRLRRWTSGQDLDQIATSESLEKFMSRTAACHEPYPADAEFPRPLGFGF